MANLEHQSSFEEKVSIDDLVLDSDSIQEGVDETNFIEIKQEPLDEEEKHSSSNGSGYEEKNPFNSHVRQCDDVDVPMPEEFQKMNKPSKLDQDRLQENLSVELCKVPLVYGFIIFFKN